MAYENLSSFTEVDPSNHWSQTTTRNTAAGLIRNEDSYIYKSYGEDYFGDYVHNIDIYWGTTDGVAHMGVWAITNDPGSYTDMSQGQHVYLYDGSPGVDSVGLHDFGTAQSDFYQVADFQETPLYFTIERSGTTLTCKIYSDSERTDLLDTPTITCADTAEEYALCGNSRESTSSPDAAFNGYCENFDIGAPIELQGSATGTSDVSGSLNVSTKLYGLTTGVLSIDGFLNVATSLIGLIVEISDVDGSLHIIKFAGFVVGVSDAEGSLDSQPELQGSATGTSDISGDLSGVSFWISPIGHNHPGEQWWGSTKIYDEYTYDDDSNSYGYSDPGDPGDWTPWIELIAPLIEASKARYEVRSDADQIDLDIYYDSAWHVILDNSAVPAFLEWVEVPFGGSYEVTKVRVRFRLDIGCGGAGVRFYEFDFWGELLPTVELQGSSVGVSGASGSLSFLEVRLRSSAVGISGADGSLSFIETLQGFTTGISGVDGSLDSQPRLYNFGAAGVSDVDGVLKIATQLVGSTVGISGVDGSLKFIITKFIGLAAGISDASGSLDTQPELGSSIIEITGVSGSLGSIEVAIQLVGSAAGVSGVDGTLNVAISLVSIIVGVLGVDGSLDTQPELIGSAVGVLSVEGYLGIVPDFDASTLFWRPQNDIVETLEWKTSILKANDGTEQRIKVRQSPRQHFKLEIVFPTNKLNTWYDSIIHTWQKLTWLIPVWPEYVEHSEDINSHDTVITVDTTNADFRDNNKAIVWKSSTEYEILVIDSKTNSQLNLSYSMLSSFTGDKYIIPVRTAYLISSSKKEKYNSEVSVVTLIFAVYDNIDQLEDYAVANYDGYEILDVPSFMGNTHLESSDGDIFIADFKTGIFKVESDSNFNFLSQNHSFFNDTKKACWDFRKFLYSLDGRQKVILIPTFRSDVVQTDNIATLDTSVKIENIGLAENMGFNSLRTYIGFYFPATGILMIRKITAITELDSLEEQIDFDVNLGSSIESGDCKIGFVDKCRLASDKVEIRWPQAHKNECRTNFMRIP